MFVERNVRYSALFTNLVGWHAGAVSFPLSDVILAQLACPLSVLITFRYNEPISLQTLVLLTVWFIYMGEVWWQKHYGFVIYGKGTNSVVS